MLIGGVSGNFKEVGAMSENLDELREDMDIPRKLENFGNFGEVGEISKKFCGTLVKLEEVQARDLWEVQGREGLSGKFREHRGREIKYL